MPRMITALRDRTIGTVTAVTLGLSALSAHGQDFMERSHKQQGPQPEVKPKIDEKAYKAALEKIPAPREKYDPWGVARPSDAQKAAKKPF